MAGSVWGLAATLLTLTMAPPLVEGRRLYDTMRYQDAIPYLQEAIRSKNVTVEDRRQAVISLVSAYTALGRTEEAQRAWEELLRLEPNTPIPGEGEVAPKIRESFERAKRALYPLDFVDLRLIGYAEDSIEVDLKDPWNRVKTFAVLVTADSGTYEELTSPAHVGLNRLSLGNGKFSRKYYVEARDLEGTSVASLGKSNQPLLVMPNIEQQPPVPQPAFRPKWVPWALAGLSVVALGTGIAFGVSSQTDSKKAEASPSARETRAFDAAAAQKAPWANAFYGAAAATGLPSAYLFWSWR